MSIEEVRDLCGEAQELLAKDDGPQALEKIERAIAMALQSLGEDHSAFPMTLVMKGWVVEALGQKRSALGMAEEGLRLAKNIDEIDFESKIVVCKQISQLFSVLKEVDKSKQVGSYVLAELVRFHGEEHPTVHLTKVEMAAWLA